MCERISQIVLWIEVTKTNWGKKCQSHGVRQQSICEPMCGLWADWLAW